MSRRMNRPLADAVAVALNRRDLLAAGGAALGLAVLPLPVLNAAGSDAAWLTDWTIDDMWGVHPRYADAIGYGRGRSDDVQAIDPVDTGFVN